MKKFLSVIMLFLALFLVACGNEDKPVDPPAGETTVSVTNLQAWLSATSQAYSTAEHGSVKLALVDGDKTTNLDLIFNYEMGRYNVSSLFVELSVNGEEEACYVYDEVAYMNRFGEKTASDLSEAQGLVIVEQYGFDAYVGSVLKMFGPSFFESATISSDQNGVATLNLNMNTYTLSENEEDQSFEFSDMIDKMAAKKSVTLKLTYASNAISKLEATLVASDDSVATITLEFLGTSDNDIAIEFPSFDDYKN